MVVQNNFVNDSRIIKEANSLGKNGYKVLVLALHEIGLKEIEKFEYFDVERVHLITRNKLSKLNVYAQSIKYIEFFNKCIRRAKIFQPDIVHCHDIYTLPIGEKIKKICKCKFIYDSHELWSDVSHRKSSYIYTSFKNNLEKKIVKKSDAVITVCNSIGNKLKEQYNLDQKIVIVRNIPLKRDLQQDNDIFRKKYNLDSEKKILLYQGGVQDGRGIEKIVRTMRYLDFKIILIILGNGSLIPDLKHLTKELKIENRVFFHDAVSQEILLDYTSSADLGIHLMENTCLNHYYALPNKIFEYIQANIPIVCSDFPEMKNIIINFKIGEVVDPTDESKIAKVINDVMLSQDKFEIYKTNCKNAKDILNWENEETILLELYRNISVSV
nr:glycosyltransferase [Alkalibaculum sporogenes]